MQFSKKELDILKGIVKKMQVERNQEKIRISARRKSQLKGKQISMGISKRKKPIRTMRKSTKKRASIR
jgi:hypothetical protein